VAGAGTLVTGSLNSQANTRYTLDFYASPKADPTGFGQGARHLGSTAVTTDGNGNASFAVSLPGATAAAEVVSATATDPTGNTSEFSHAVTVADLLAVAGGPYGITYGSSLILHGSANPDVDAFGYTWAINGHANAATGASPTLTWSQLAALGVRTGQVDTVSVQVDDGHGHTATAQTTLTVNKAAADITVTPYTGTYDGWAHGLSGTATGALGEDLGALLSLGAGARNAGHYDVAWSFAGNDDYHRRRHGRHHGAGDHGRHHRRQQGVRRDHDGHHRQPHSHRGSGRRRRPLRRRHGRVRHHDRRHRQDGDRDRPEPVGHGRRELWVSG
jgi:hypothetical protein